MRAAAQVHRTLRLRRAIKRRTIHEEGTTPLSAPTRRASPPRLPIRSFVSSRLGNLNLSTTKHIARGPDRTVDAAQAEKTPAWPIILMLMTSDECRHYELFYQSTCHYRLEGKTSRLIQIVQVELRIEKLAQHLVLFEITINHAQERRSCWSVCVHCLESSKREKSFFGGVISSLICSQQWTCYSLSPH